MADGGAPIVHGEILAPAAGARVIACPRPFSSERVDRVVRAGLSIAEIVKEAGIPEFVSVHVWISDAAMVRDPVYVPPEWRARVRPKPGSIVTLRAVPLGGGGGGKNPLRLFLTIAVIAAAFALPGLILGAELASTTIFGSLTYGQLLGGAIGLLGNMLINAIVPPPRPSNPALQPFSWDSARTNPTYAITGTQNREAPFAAIPRVYGRRKVFPPLAAKSYTEVVEDKTFFRMVFDFGYGPLQLSDLRIGTTPIAQFEDLDYEIRQGFPNDPPLTLFTRTVHEDSYAIRITEAGGAQTVQTRGQTDEIVLDLSFRGLVSFDNFGSRGTRTVQVKIEYREAGAPDWVPAGDRTLTSAQIAVAAAVDVPEQGHYDWNGPMGTRRWVVDTPASHTNAKMTLAAGVWPAFAPGEQVTISGFATPANNGTFTVRSRTDAVLELDGALAAEAAGASATVTNLIAVSAATEQLVMRSFRIKPANRGTFEVRIARITADTTSAQIRDEMYLTAVRSFTNEDPIRATGHCLVAMRARGTDQLNGIIQQFSAIAESILPVWDGAAWANQVTGNPAWVYLDALTGSATKRPVGFGRVALDDFKTWADACDAPDQNGEPRYRCDLVVDARTTLFDALRDIAPTGRATFGMRDGKFSIVRDVPQTVPIQHFTPRNSWGFRGAINFPDKVHGIKVRWVNPDKDWDQDELLVFDDGYNADNATDFETVDFPGLLRRSQVWRDGRYWIAANRLRPEAFEFHSDIENLVCTRGDLVCFAHDVPRVGGYWGRIKSVQADGGGNVTALTVDEPVVMETGKAYGVRVRLATGASVTAPAVSVAGETSVIALSSAIPAASAPAAGDLFAFGEIERETINVLVKQIIAGLDLTARLVVIPAAPAIHEVDTGPIPPYDPQQTFLPSGPRGIPLPPAVADAVSDETALIEIAPKVFQVRIAVRLRPRTGTGTAADELRVQYRRAGSGQSWTPLPNMPATASEVSVMPVEAGYAYDVRLGYVTAAGVASDWTLIENHTAVGGTTPPSDVDEVSINGDAMSWPYPSPPRDFGGFAVRHRPGTLRQWEGAAPAHEGLLAAASFDLSGLPRGLRTVMVKAVDVFGNESANAAVIVRDLGDPQTDNVVLTEDFAIAGWPGTITGGAVVNGAVAANDTTLYLENPTAVYLPEGGGLYLPSAYVDVSYAARFTPPLDAIPSTVTLSSTITGDSWTIDYRSMGKGLYLPEGDDIYLSDGAALYLGGPSSWFPWPGALAAKREATEIRATVAAGNNRGIVSALAAIMDVPDEDEDLEDVPIAAVGARLPLTKRFRRITHVTLNLQDDGGTATTARALDKDVITGPFVRCYDQNAAAAAGTVDAYIRGIKGPDEGDLPAVTLYGAAAPHALIFDTPGTYSFIVAAGVTALNCGLWGAGGAGGGNGAKTLGGIGGAGAFEGGTIPVNPGDTVTVVVGAPGNPGSTGNVGGGAGGGGRTEILVNGVRKLVAGAGAGGGGGDNSTGGAPGGQGGHGGAPNGNNGGAASSGGTTEYGAGGTQAAGGAGGDADAGNGAALSGGKGADGGNGWPGGGTGGAPGGGNGGGPASTNLGGGGAGGDGYFGGGGGNNAEATYDAGSGGGAGSSWAAGGVTGVTPLAGNGQIPPNTTHQDYQPGAASGGAPASAGGPGLASIRWAA